MPLVTVLPILRPLLLCFAALFSKPQQRHFDNYIQSLIIQEHRRTLTQMRYGAWPHLRTTPPESLWTIDVWDLQTAETTLFGEETSASITRPTEDAGLETKHRNLRD
jgi:hypothetical protein